ncbi:hypothetical protein [Isoptericola haloaureus]|uniref:Uncharacterized protein n=1 Tax=Isoptericola haloaureus TaxID=1542902 RepID=A0ABU7Z861_9MICO
MSYAILAHSSVVALRPSEVAGEIRVSASEFTDAVEDLRLAGLIAAHSTAERVDLLGPAVLDVFSVASVDEAAR